ncbi:5-formyltetrahydrofolate cyclo-ligase [Nitratireductor mangrovi]|uniref:5-formyltetrahydrofolate cyclo-ligase n=1 Tax=Nitratireductor mangrovi TaxID=2599600 RepID=A0A5B8L384_9HYPH|nr:5-formyltetrahydrofolate cyclo-ligase [Nitratireductor mangrovi]QDZ02008.1 5-formyltetrahydrofolate cyclo-ligase [Nitratireductor mangrovi]
MADEEHRSPGAGYASPPCFMHELQPGYAAAEADPQAVADVMRWRKAERQRLIEKRLAVSADERAAMAGRIAEHLWQTIGEPAGRRLSLYWPFRGEPDLRGFAAEFHADGGSLALPVVIEKAAPLVFRDWRPRMKLEKGVWNIPVPPEAPAVVPDIVIAPVVGFDARSYRLGYGGGFFDRTLAALPARPLVIGVGYADAAIATIYPQAHDIAMDFIVTEDGRVG